ncbi:acyl-CoA dehydrogenase [Sinobaca sp. H24]|uniref:acyl-CoA dehydrogenase n=1 Tax=Sinobaca sp. H24 TaxID=2923376 RepID=UPI0020797DC3|nr:acyl-CoA dehydrogenase [Sinobaca sp. H24]
MNLQWTDEQQMMRKTARQFAEKEVAPEVTRMEEEDRFPVELVQKMAGLGFMGIPIAEEWGGAGMDFPSYILAIHEISKKSAALGVILSVHTSVGTTPIVHFGTDKQKAHYLPKLASGEYLGAFALTEAGSGSDASSLKTTAEKKDGRYVLNGSKVFITNAGAADTYIVFASTAPGTGAKGISAFIVEKDFPGFSVGKKERKMGMHGSNTCEIILDQCEVPVENLLGREGEGFSIALSNLYAGRVGIAAQSLGIAEAALEAAVAYAKERRQFGKPIGSMQGISFKLADMATKVEAARLLVYQAADAYEKGKATAQSTSMTKLFASKTAVDVSVEAVQVFGGYGYTKEYPVERFFRDAKVCEIYEGTSEIQRIVIGKSLMA